MDKVENVLTVNRELLLDFISQNGIITEDCEEAVNIIIRAHEFTPRPDAEINPDKKQIIPYVVLCEGDKVFCTRRLNKGGEARLHGLLSLGIGGHISLEKDGNGIDVLYRGMLREILEEVNITKFGKFEFKGLINDDSNEVGSVHLGLFYTLEVSGEVTVRETEKLEGLWLKRSELKENFDKMETWSQLVSPQL